MRTQKVRVVAYDPAWPAEFRRVEAELAAALAKAPFACTIHHVGSTSVPGLAAKPILDIDIEIPSTERFDQANALLEAAGYRHEGDLGIPGREAFRYDGKEHLMAHHLYVCASGAEELKRHTGFRDWLRTHADDRNAYGDVKARAAAAHPDDIDAYMREKSGIIGEIYQKAALGAGIQE